MKRFASCMLLALCVTACAHDDEPPERGFENCTDNKDNDGDGLVDGDDSDCPGDDQQDILPSCGDGKVSPPQEHCDNAIEADQQGACPAACDDHDACTIDELVGLRCQARCEFTEVTACVSGDGCCPRSCNIDDDSDCDPDCGDGVVTYPELCDKNIDADQVGACPTACDDGNTCTADILQDGDTCQAQCTNTVIESCDHGDGCCPAGCNALDDDDCSASCNNGVLEERERCDTKIPAGQPGACPTDCDDSNACTADVLLNADTCGALCSNRAITACTDGDGCCPAGCSANSDDDCSASCNNGVLEERERCDTKIPAGQPGACPTECDDGNACTTDTLTNGGTCGALCTNNIITSCTSGDGCCPTGCNANTDDDCSPDCGNGVVEPRERCDTRIAAGRPGACPTECDDGNACTTDTLTNGGTCGALCTNGAITTCVSDDGCCPTGCNANSDSDCSPNCGNGVLEPRERCDTRIAAGKPGACPTECDDGNACTTDTLTNGGTCGALCTNSDITSCTSGDGCCPRGCNANNDDDCSPDCGNGVVEPRERCDIRIPAGQSGACPTTCDDGESCTVDNLANAGTCGASCSYRTITSCVGGDDCCPAGCNANNDTDCSPDCGNGVLEGREKCDVEIPDGQKGSCPTKCDDRDTCTIDTLLNGDTCDAVCVARPITQCNREDGCCPPGCNAANDVDCPTECGDGVVTGSERCDTAITSGAQACPTQAGCTKQNTGCTRYTLTAGGSCEAHCESSEIKECNARIKDGCCPTACNAANDLDCITQCGDGVITGSETCDTAITTGDSACPTQADCAERNNGCTAYSLVGSGCQVTCRAQTVSACRVGLSDGCCPPGCNAVNDADCQTRCGDTVVTGNETCDTAITSGTGVCPTQAHCTRQDQECTAHTLVAAGTCQAKCESTTIDLCIARIADGCCPPACNAALDADCPTICGDGVVTGNETCDTNVAGRNICPTEKTCAAKSEGCSVFELSAPGPCRATCVEKQIDVCSNTAADGCCPARCNAANDADCKTVCGDGVVTGQETCDIAISDGKDGFCPTSGYCREISTACKLFKVVQDDDKNPCSAHCELAREITQCGLRDGCCPDGCAYVDDKKRFDVDCPRPVCGDGILQPGEKCDPKSKTNPCPTSCRSTLCTKGELVGDKTDPCQTQCIQTPRCNDNNRCTTDLCDQRTGRCAFVPIPRCIIGPITPIPIGELRPSI